MSEREKEGDTMNPNEKLAMTDKDMATAESSISPMWPTKMLVKEFIP